MSETITLVHPTFTGEVDRHLDPVEDDPDTTQVPGCKVAPRSSAEDNSDSRRAVISGLTIYMPAGAPMPDPADRMLVRGVLYELDGEPGDWRSPWGSSLGGYEVNVTKVDG